MTVITFYYTQAVAILVSLVSNILTRTMHNRTNLKVLQPYYVGRQKLGKYVDATTSEIIFSRCVNFANT